MITKKDVYELFEAYINAIPKEIVRNYKLYWEIINYPKLTKYRYT